MKWIFSNIRRHKLRLKFGNKRQINTQHFLPWSFKTIESCLVCILKHVWVQYERGPKLMECVAWKKMLGQNPYVPFGFVGISRDRTMQGEPDPLSNRVLCTPNHFKLFIRPPPGLKTLHHAPFYEFDNQ